MQHYWQVSAPLSEVLVNEIEIRSSQLKSHPFFEMDEAHFVANLPFNPLGGSYFEFGDSQRASKESSIGLVAIVERAADFHQ